jgi:hypothetical protein
VFIGGSKMMLREGYFEELIFKKRSLELLNYMFVLFMIIVLAFAPFFAFWGVIIFFVLFSSSINNTTRRLAGFVIMVAGCVCYSSRACFLPSDDIQNYYEIFTLIHDGTFRIDFFGTAYPEIVTTFFFKVLSFFFGYITPSGLMFFSSLSSSLLFLFWIEKYGLVSIKRENRALCVACTLTFFSFMLSTQAIRQMLAITLVLNALFTKRKRYQFIIMVLAVFTHSSALPLFVMTKGFFKWPFKTIVVIISMLGFSALSYINLISKLPFVSEFPFINKLHYFRSFDLTLTNINLKTLLLFLIILVFYFSSFYNSASNSSNRWRDFCIGYTLLYFSLFPFHNMSERVALPLVGFLTGYVLFLSVGRLSIFLQGVLPIFALWRLCSLTIIYHPFEHALPLWHFFSYVGYIPFYYFTHYW